MCARSHASGLISAECAVSTSASERPATRARVRSRASARSAAAAEAARRGCVAAIAANATESVARASTRTPGAAPDLDDLAYGRGAPGDPRVQGPDDQLEAARLELLELRDERVKAAALLVDQHDVAGADPLRGRAAGALGARGRVDVDQRGLGLGHTGRRLDSAPDGLGDRLPDLTVQADVLLALRADADDRRSVSGERARERRPEALEVRGAFEPAAVELRRLGRIEPVRRRHVLHVVLGRLRPADGEEVEDAAPV